METDFLRLILFLAGVVVVLIVYFWERHKRLNAQVDAIRNAEQNVDNMRHEMESDSWVVMEEYQDDASAEIDRSDAYYEEDMLQDQDTATDVDGITHELEQLSGLVAEESVPSLDQAEQIPLFVNDEVDAPPPTNDAAAKVFVINLASRQAGFNGADIVNAAADVGLELGEMDIFHRYRETQGGRKTPLFNMASMVEPGTFPLDNMEGFVTPGLSLFVQIATGEGGLALYDEMLMAAEKLAQRLNGELQDETHCALTRQAIEFQREEIIEYQRRQMLVKNNR